MTAAFNQQTVKKTSLRGKIGPKIVLNQSIKKNKWITIKSIARKANCNPETSPNENLKKSKKNCKYNRLTSGELLSNDWRVVGFVSSLLRLRVVGYLQKQIRKNKYKTKDHRSNKIATIFV